jgi:undecaprenyl phosphate-alpha-L-ara4FN deformylase
MGPGKPRAAKRSKRLDVAIDVGLRIDVDTYRGTKIGVPHLLAVLARHGIRASFFFSVGPDNMGRHLWRLLRPTFLWKMLRTRAASLYGWDILLRGTLWPGPVIGKHLAPILRATAKGGHEVGLHAWDHHAWQTHIASMDASAIRRSLTQGYEMLTEILGSPPTCSAVPGWKCNDSVLREKGRFPFRYNSDCRGRSIFRPVVENQILFPPQIPVTLPTYDEIIGRHGITHENYNAHLLSLIEPNRLNVLTIHAEVEGIAHAALFDRFLEMAQERDVVCRPLGSLLDSEPVTMQAPVIPGMLSGREGWVAVQEGD